MLQILASLGTSDGDAALMALDISVSNELFVLYEHEGIDTGVTRMRANTALLLKSFPPLMEITLDEGFGVKAFSSLLGSHCESLRKLIFRPETKYLDFRGHRKERPLLSLRQARELVQYCPKLRHLGVSVPRTQGDEEEKNLYGTLGDLRHLQTLRLTLDHVDDYIQDRAIRTRVWGSSPDGRRKISQERQLDHPFYHCNLQDDSQGRQSLGVSPCRGRRSPRSSC